LITKVENQMKPPKVLTAGGATASPTRPIKLSKKNISNEFRANGDGSLIDVSSNKETSTSVRINSISAREIFELVPLEDDRLRPNDTDGVVITPSWQSEQVQASSSSSTVDLSMDKMTDSLMHDASDSLAAIEKRKQDIFWLALCFFGIMFSFVLYGLLLEYTTSGGRQLHEMSFLFITSLLYTITAAAGRYVRDEKPSSIPPARFAVLGITSMGSTFCSVRSLRYVIYPIQVLAKSCKPVPVMLMGALMGKKYPLKKYINVVMIVVGVGLFMGGADSKKKETTLDESSSTQIMGIILLFISLCFDGGTGAYEDKLMSVHHVGPFDLMYNIQLGKTILAGIGLIVLNQVHIFLQMVQEMGFLLVALGLSGAIGQVFIFVTISKFGALTCSIIGLARKVTTLVASIYFYGHVLNSTQGLGLVVCITAMLMNFAGKSGKKANTNSEGDKQHINQPAEYSDQISPMLTTEEKPKVDVELGTSK